MLNYIQQHRHEYAAVFWVEAGSKAAIERDFIQIYQLLYNVHNHPGLGSGRIEDAVPAVKRWFYGREKTWLFVFDSADNVDHEREPSYINLRYFLPDDPSVQVVVTTRNANVRKMGQLEGVEVGEMKKKEATALFLKQAKMVVVSREQEEEVGKIVEELGHLALAVMLAGSYVATSPRLRGNIQRYLPEYRQRRKELLQRQPEKLVDQYGASVLTTWETSFEAVQRQNVQASQLLCLLGFLHWDDILISLFEGEDHEEQQDGEQAREQDGEQTQKEGERQDKQEEKEQSDEDDIEWKSFLFSSDTVSSYDIEQQLSILRTYSLLKLQDISDSYSMHKLIHAWVSDRLSDEVRTRYILTSMLLLNNTLHYRRHHSPEMKTRLIPHLMSNFMMLLASIEELELDEVVLDHFRAIAVFIDSAGLWSDAILVKRAIFERVRRVYGMDHVDAISAMGNLASTLGDMGEMQAAVTMKREVVEKMKRILGEEHPNTISAMNNLASTLGEMGEMQAAMSMEREVLKKSKQILGEEHPDTISAMGNLASTLGEMGEMQAAMSMEREVLKKSKQILGEEHPDTTSAMNNLANTLGEMGEMQAAVTMQREVVDMRKRILGEQHPKTVSATQNLQILISRGDNTLHAASPSDRSR